MAFFSIQLNSNRPQQILVFFDAVEQTADLPEDIEVLLHIDRGDTAMEELVEEEKLKRRFKLRVLQTDLVKGYSTLWKPLNPLWEMTDPEAYFLINLSDEVLFETSGWDSIARKYVGYYPDHIFRLRGSKYRFRNYTDYWENGFAPDSMAFYTRRWMELSGNWNPCLGPDSFQQCVSFYLFTSDPFSHVQYNRDIPVAELEFSGEGASIGLEGRAKFQRIRENNRAWFVLMSHRIQQEAKRRAMRMKSHMIAHTHGGERKTRIVECTCAERFIVLSTETGESVARCHYGLSRWRITLTNIWRAPRVLYYGGGGEHALQRPMFSVLVMVATYVRFGTDMLVNIEKAQERYGRWKARMRGRVRTAGSFVRSRAVTAPLRHIARVCGRAKDWKPEGSQLQAKKVLSVRLSVFSMALLGMGGLDWAAFRLWRMVPAERRRRLNPAIYSWWGRSRRYLQERVRVDPPWDLKIPRLLVRIPQAAMLALYAPARSTLVMVDVLFRRVRRAWREMRRRRRERAMRIKARKECRCAAYLFATFRSGEAGQ